MRLIDADSLDDFLDNAELEAQKQRRYVLASALNIIRGNLRNFQTIEPERKSGKWEKVEVIYGKDENMAIEEWQQAQCSVCGLWHTTPYMYYVNRFNYCPNCGADMRGEEDDS